MRSASESISSAHEASRPSARADAAAISATLTNSAKKVFVAATARSGPASRWAVISDAVASSEDASLVSATVSAPRRLADSTSAIMSGPAPD